MVIDTSALLASLFAEEKSTWVEDQLNNSQSVLLMSTVNLTEVLILLSAKQKNLFEELKNILFQLPIEFVPPTQKHAKIAATARLEYTKLNFGDCFAYALAKDENDVVLTLDSDFKNTDVKILTV